MAMFKFSVDKSEFVGQMARVSERNSGAPAGSTAGLYFMAPLTGLTSSLLCSYAVAGKIRIRRTLRAGEHLFFTHFPGLTP